MNLTKTYQSLAQAFSYPWDKEELILSVAQIAAQIEEAGRENPLAGLAEFISRTDLSGIQEEYVSTFDLSPACAPYVGYHLYGDTHKKGEHMIAVKGIFRDHGYHPPADELPDHLSVLFDFAAHLTRKGADDERKHFIVTHVLTGAKKMKEIAVNKPDMHWKDLITAACVICTADCEEVILC
ncbi:MAG TPA: nitrate reductase molybdenum cofactor assembly chaperone [Desulfatiglandales bacterium]|nr:nitrate reductase molybdenum cofactor assembly chaperone [Desulfatiglandales bacterium]